MQWFSRMKQYALMLAVLGTAAVVYELQGWLAEAASGMSGTGVTIGGVDNIAMTVADYAKGNVGKMIAIVMVMGGLGMSLSGRMGSGMGVAGTGVAAAFVPNIVDTAFDTTQAATLVPVLQSAPAALSGGAGWLTQAGLALSWPFFLVVKLLRDPVVWGALGMTALVKPALMLGFVRQLRRHRAVGAA